MMNEAETRAELIDPALKAAGWGTVAGSSIRREVIAPGRLVGNNQRARSDIADYVLVYRGEKLAVIEAKRRDLPDTAGLGQAKKYAEKLETRFAYSTNGIGIYQVDMHTGVEGYINQLINAEKSDLYDVLAYIAYASPPISCRERVLAHKSLIFSRYTGKQQEFLELCPNQYIKTGVGELDRTKLPQLLELKYHTINDAMGELGAIANINEVFIGFQQYLYSHDIAA